MCCVLSVCCVVYFASDCLLLLAVFFSRIFFFKQKTAYEMRISDWSSDVCSSDLIPLAQATMIGTPEIIAEQQQQVDRQQLLTMLDDKEVQKKLVSKIGRASCRERVCQYV